MQAQGGLVARAANRQLGKSDREAAGVLSAAQRHTHFLDFPRMATVLGGSDFTFAGLKDEPATVFLVLPPDRLASYARWLRLMAGYRVQVWPILQDVHQLRTLYGQRAGTFLSNAGVLQVLGPTIRTAPSWSPIWRGRKPSYSRP